MTVQNLKLRVPVSFPASVTGYGGISVSKANGVWEIGPDFSELSAVVASAVTDPSLKEIWLFDPGTNEYNVLTLGGLGDALYKLTSTTSLSVGTGSKTFTTQANKDIQVGSWVLVVSDAAPATNFMCGQVTAYSSTSLTVSATYSQGSGTHADWTIRVAAPPGSSGKSAGYSYGWLTSTTNSDPGSGNIKADNATFASIASIYISESDADGNALASEIATWTASTSTVKGRLKIYDPVTPTNFMTFDVTALTDNGAWDTLSVTPKTSGGSFAASEALRVMFTPTGDKGAAGATGTVAAAGDGSAATPAVSFANELTTGFYRKGASNVGLSLGGTLKFEWNTTNFLLPADPTSALAAATKQYVDDNPATATGTGDAAKSIAATDAISYTTAALTAPRTWTLPAASSVGVGKRRWIVDLAAGITSANTLTVARNGSDTIQGTIIGTAQTGVVMSHAGEAVCLMSDGVSKWTLVEHRRLYAQLDQTGNLTVGFTATSYSGGTITGSGQTFTPAPASGNFQHITLNGSSLTGTFTFAAPSSVCTMVVEVTNGGSGVVGATLSTSGYTKVTGDTYATTNGNKYLFFITKSNGYSHLHIQALQ